MAVDTIEEASPAAPVGSPEPDTAQNKRPEPSEEVKAFVTGWCDRIVHAKAYYKNTFDRMRKSMEIVKFGDTKDWVGKDGDSGKYTVPIASRHINQSVAQLYAKNPKSFAERKKRRMGQVWDGDVKTLQEALLMQQAATQAGAPVDPNVAALVADAQQVQQYIRMMDGLADTLNILDDYFINEQAANFKQQMKAAVRRAKVCGVAYVTLGYQRILEKRQDVTGRIEDSTSQIKLIEQRLREAGRDPDDEDKAKLEELRAALADLQSKEYLIVREGPVHGFPRATSVIVDPCVTHLKTLTGANWWAEEYEMTAEDIETQYGVDIRGNFKKYTPAADAKPKWSDKQGKAVKQDLAMVWKVQDKRSGLEFVICEGFNDYLKEPACPDVKIERFFNLFPLVLNEIEDEEEQIPPSDVWNIRHTQREYNAARHGLAEHRKASKPGTYGPTGALKETDLAKLAARAANDHIEIGALSTGQKLTDVFAAIPTVQIDEKVYDVEPLYGDLLRTVGSQAATQGTTRGDTATESSIAEASREVADASNVDDIDDLLTELAKARGQLMLLELSKDIVLEIVGPGAVWPDMPQTREEIAKDLVLTIKAGSSGRPNKAAKIANMERAMPTVVQLPGLNATPIAEEYLNLLEIDTEEAIVEGAPSIVAQNAMASKPSPQPGTGDPKSDPGAQGAEGADNAPAPAQNEPQSQPAFPAGPQGMAASNA